MPPYKPCPPRICEGCGVTYRRTMRDTPVTFNRRRFCTRACDLAHRTVRQDDEGGRSIARKLYPLEPCEDCGSLRSERHHIDSDRLNNLRSNIAFLCRRHHKAAHRLSDGRVGGGHRPRVNRMLAGRAMQMAAQARRMREIGLHTNEIADILGVHPVSVARWFRKYPVEIWAVREGASSAVSLPNTSMEVGK